MRLADELDAGSLLVAARYFLCLALLGVGPLQQALELTEESLVLLEADQSLGAELIGYDPLAAVLGQRGILLACAGRIADAEEAMSRSIEQVHEKNDRVALALVEGWAAWVYELKGDGPRALAHSRRAVEAAERVGGTGILSVAYAGRGRALFLAGQFNEVVEVLEQKVGSPSIALMVHRLLVLAQLERGELDAARAGAFHGVEDTASSSWTLLEGEARLTLATILLRTTAFATTTACS